MTASLRQTLIDAWASLTQGSPGGREWRALRIASGHALEVFAAVRESDAARGVLFECPLSSAPTWRMRFDSEGLQLLDDRDAAEGVRRIALALERTDLDSIFQIIAEDLVVASSSTSDAEDALSALGARLSAWQTCLKLRKDGFGQERMRGLYGELIVLERLALIVGFSRALIAWIGPERGLHDFSADDLAIEVKTSAGASTSVWIGSLDQLDPSGMRKLVLCRVVVVPDDQGVSLSGLVARLRSLADSLGANTRRIFDQRLLMSGHVDHVGRDAANDPLAVIEVEAYSVQGSFPRITRETVPAAVLATEYRLDLTGAQDCRMTAAELDELMLRIGGKF
jgi:hypothetical protein